MALEFAMKRLSTVVSSPVVLRRNNLQAITLSRTFSSRTTEHISFNKTEFRKPDPSKPRIVLAYSGGLDTSTQLAYLANEKGFEVCAYIANLGQDDCQTAEAQEEICAKAEQSGAYCFYNEDVRQDFVSNYVFRAIAHNCLYEGRYLLGTAVARPCIAKRQTEIAWTEGAKFLSHGSTGKGNDQVRFELCYLGMDPSLDCVTLWRDPEYLNRFQGRQDLIDYATAHGIPVGATKEFSYSEDENIMHISYESGELEDPAYPGNNVEYPGMVMRKKTRDIMDTPDEPANLTIHFEKGTPSRVVNQADGVDLTDPLQLFSYLNDIGGKHGCGRIDLVENRFVGMKSRGCYETPGATVLFAAHRDLELLTIDREVQKLRDMLSQQASYLVYNGHWFSPEMEFLQNALDHAQRPVSGSVDVRLHKANVMCRGRQSPYSLYNQDLVSMDVEGGFDATNSTGFINTLATRLQASAARDEALP